MKMMMKSSDWTGHPAEADWGVFRALTEVMEVKQKSDKDEEPSVSSGWFLKSNMKAWTQTPGVRVFKIKKKKSKSA